MPIWAIILVTLSVALLVFKILDKFLDQLIEKTFKLITFGPKQILNKITGKGKSPRAKKVKVSYKEKARKKKMEKLRVKKYEEYILTRAIYNIEAVNSNVEVIALENTQASARENEKLKKELKNK